jgi:hypothetical protein
VSYATSLAACGEDDDLEEALREVVPEVRAYLARKGTTFGRIPMFARSRLGLRRAIPSPFIGKVKMMRFHHSRLRRELAVKGLSVKRLAEMAHVSYGTARRAFDGQRVRRTSAIKLTDALDRIPDVPGMAGVLLDPE